MEEGRYESQCYPGSCVEAYVKITSTSPQPGLVEGMLAAVAMLVRARVMSKGFMVAEDCVLLMHRGQVGVTGCVEGIYTYSTALQSRGTTTQVIDRMDRVRIKQFPIPVPLMSESPTLSTARLSQDVVACAGCVYI